jgi:hypothetical protein
MLQGFIPGYLAILGDNLLYFLAGSAALAAAVLTVAAVLGKQARQSN